MIERIAAGQRPLCIGGTPEFSGRRGVRRGVETKGRNMYRKLRIIGLAVVAVFALTAVAAVAAVAAQAAEFHSEVAGTKLVGTQQGENIFTTAAGNVKCKEAQFNATTTTTTVSQLQITPTYKKCTAFGQAAEVTVNQVWDFTAASATTGEVVLTATSIVIDVPSGNCTITVPEGTPGKNNVKFTEVVGAKREVLVTSEVSEIKYVVSGAGTICGTSGSHSGVGGATYDGSVLVQGFNDSSGAQVGVWVA